MRGWTIRFPEQKDIVIFDAEPHSGKEYGGDNKKVGNFRRHLVVMSSSSYSKATGMILAMPITTAKRYANNPRYFPLLIPGPENSGVKGYIALWQLQNFDFISRNGQIVNQISDKTYQELVPFVKDMLGL